MARNLSSGFLSIFSGRLVILVVTFVTTPILVRALSPTAYGNYQFLLSFFAIFTIFVSSGVTEGVQKFVSERKRYPAWREHVVGFYFVVAVVLAIVGAGVLAIGAQFNLVQFLVGSKNSSGSFQTYFFLLAALVAITNIRSFSRRTLMGLGLERYSEPLRIVAKLIWVVLGVGLAVMGYGVVGILLGHIVSSLFYAVVGFFLVVLNVRVRKVLSRPHRDFPYRELLSFNVLNVFLILLLTSLYKTDVMMIRYFLGGASTGYYSAALALAEYLWFVPASLQSLFLHSTSELWSQGRTRAVSDLAARVTRYNILLTALLAVGIAALANQFVPLYYSPSYTPAITPLLFLLPGAVGFAIARPLFGLAQGHGDLRALLLGTGASSLVNVVLNAILIPVWGITGASIATSIGYGAMILVTAVAVRRLGVNPFADIRPVSTGVTVVVGSLIIFGLASITPGGILAFIVVPIGGAIAYGGLAATTGAVSIHESADIAASFPGPLGSIGRRFRERIHARARRPADTTSIVPRAVLGVGATLFVVGLLVTAVTGGFTGIGLGGNTSIAPSPPSITTPSTHSTTKAPTTTAPTTTHTATATTTPGTTNKTTNNTTTRTTNATTPGTTNQTTTNNTTTINTTTKQPTTTTTNNSSGGLLGGILNGSNPTTTTTKQPTTTTTTTTTTNNTNNTTTNSTTTNSTTTNSTTTNSTSTNNSSTTSSSQSPPSPPLLWSPWLHGVLLVGVGWVAVSELI